MVYSYFKMLIISGFSSENKDTCWSYHEISPHWEYFNDACYHVVERSTALSWQEAEGSCTELANGAHLASIRDLQDAEFIHFMIVSKWAKPQADLYIGKGNPTFALATISTVMIYPTTKS